MKSNSSVFSFLDLCCVCVRVCVCVYVCEREGEFQEILSHSKVIHLPPRILKFSFLLFKWKFIFFYKTCCERYSFFLQMDNWLSQHHLLKSHPLPVDLQYYLSYYVKCTSYMDLFLGFLSCSVSLIVLMPIAHSVNDYSFIVCHNIW